MSKAGDLRHRFSIRSMTNPQFNLQIRLSGLQTQVHMIGQNEVTELMILFEGITLSFAIANTFISSYKTAHAHESITP